MRYKAVIFDLFGTLVEFSPAQHRRVMSEMMGTLSIPDAECVHLWADAYHLQEIGQPIEKSIEWVCRNVEVKPEPDQVATAVKIWCDFQRNLLRPPDESIETLGALRARGYSIGLISNCPSEVPILWNESPLASLLDVAIFSSTCGLRKPDPRIYEDVCQQLGVVPEHCVYVGDGGSDELLGAAAIGMRAVFLDPRNCAPEDEKIELRVSWTGHRISRLRETLDQLEGGPD